MVDPSIIRKFSGGFLVAGIILIGMFYLGINCLGAVIFALIIGALLGYILRGKGEVREYLLAGVIIHIIALVIFGISMWEYNYDLNIHGGVEYATGMAAISVIIGYLILAIPTIIFSTMGFQVGSSLSSSPQKSK